MTIERIRSTREQAISEGADPRRARRIIRGWEGVRAYTGLGRSQLQEKIAQGTFPPPIKLSERAIGWFEDTLREWQDGLASGEDE